MIFLVFLLVWVMVVLLCVILFEVQALKVLLKRKL